MASYDIALSGLRVAQRAIELVGTNIANASTKGYHRQQLVTIPFEAGGTDNIAGGVRIVDVSRAVDILLEREIVLQQPQLGQNTQELATLKLIENSIGDLDSQGLALAMDNYFNALHELSSQPNSQSLRYQVAWAADGLADQFRFIGSFLSDLDRQMALEAQSVTNEINELLTEIGSLNGQINNFINKGANANTLRDSRDQAVLKLGELIDITVTRQSDPSGMVSISGWGTPLIINRNVTLLETQTRDGGKLGMSVKDANYFQTDISGGKLGGLFSLKNELMPAIRDKLDNLAGEIISRTNQYHVQGVGDFGSFTSLSGWDVNDAKLSEWSAWGGNLSAGTINVRVVNQSTGEVKRYSITVDGDSTAASIAADFNALAEINANVSGSILNIESADTSLYKFDFLPVPVTDMATNPWTASVNPAVSGTYDGSSNEKFTFTVAGTGLAGDEAQIGITDDLAIEMRNEAGQLIKTVNIGLGYVAGETIDMGNGMTLSFATGTVKLGEKFEVTALADSDDSGFLAAAGINAFFSGTDAGSIAVRSDILSDPLKIATSVTADATDNVNVQKMADLGSTNLANLGNITPNDYFRQIVTGIGQDISFRESRQTSLEGALEQLGNEKERISGVDINEEAAKLLVYEQMYQAAAKFMSVQTQMIKSLMSIM